MFISQGHSISKVLKFAGVASSTWYANIKKNQIDNRKHNKGRPFPGFIRNIDGIVTPDSELIDILKKYRSSADFENGGGYLKLKHYLRRDFGFCINKKKVYRICKENNFLLPKKKKNKRRGKLISINRVINGPNQLWEFDIKYGYIHGENRFFFFLGIIDVFTRHLVNFHVGLTCNASDLKFTLENALKIQGIKSEDNLAIRSDNGPQMTSFMFRKFIDELEINLDHEFIPVKTPNKNAHIESFFSILEIEFLQTKYFNNFEEAYIACVEFVERYNTRRIHGSLGFKTPQEVVNDLKLGNEVKIKEVRC
jgi:putative transposase